MRLVRLLPSKSARRRYELWVSQWLSSWVPEPKNKDFCEAMKQAFIQKDAPDGVTGKSSSLFR